MKSIRKSNLFTTTVIMLCIFSILGFWGCEKESLYESSYSEFLDLKTYEQSQMSLEDMEIIGLALQRLDIDKKNKLYQIKQTYGAQVNISENLFDYIKKGFEYTNKALNSKSLNSSIVRLKSGNTEDDDPEPQDSTHCAIYALVSMGAFSYDVVAAYSDSLYGTNGIPSDSMDSFVNHFYPGLSPTSPNSLSTGTMNTNLLYFQTSDSTGHAVNGTFYDKNSGCLLYNDPQTGTTGVVNISDVLGIYFP